MAKGMTRREVLMTGLTAASLAAMGLPEWTLPGLAQGETVVPFTDIPDTVSFTLDPKSGTRVLDIRTVTEPFTAKDQFYCVQHLGQPEIDSSTYRLKITGAVEKPAELSLENALRPEPLLAYALNGDPLTRQQGAPMRLIVPGWYGVANVKWLSQIHIQRERFVGNYQARWYLSLKSETVNGQEIWKETEVT